jgi:hypothetical protein
MEEIIGHSIFNCLLPLSRSFADCLLSTLPLGSLSLKKLGKSDVSFGFLINHGFHELTIETLASSFVHLMKFLQ